MAKIRVEQVLDHLGPNLRRALDESVKNVIPGATFDADKLFSEFKRNVRLRCRQWEQVPSQYVDAD